MSTPLVRPRESWDGIDAAPAPTARTLTHITLTHEAARLDARALHVRLEDACDGLPGRIVWAHPTRGRLILQSDGTPDEVALSRLGHPHSAVVPLVHEEGARIQLAGVINATVQDRREDGRGVRRACPTHLVPEWVQARLAGVVDITTIETEELPRIHASKPGHRVTLARAGIAAAGTVLSAHRLAHILAAGLGHGRAYGCGLILATGVTR